jgi:hypothetical protein
MKKKNIFELLKKPFIVNTWPTCSYAHGNSDYEHYYIEYYSPNKKKILKTEWCEAGCGDLPFDDVMEEVEKYYDMGKIEYWRSYGVPEKYIIRTHK